MLTDEQALRFCACHCKQRDPLGLYGHQGVCEDCKGSGINTDKRAELEELIRQRCYDAWKTGFYAETSERLKNPFHEKLQGCPVPEMVEKKGRSS